MPALRVVRVTTSAEGLKSKRRKRMPKQGTLVGALNEIAANLSEIGPGTGPDREQLEAGPFEEAIIRYSVGTGTVREGKGKEAGLYIIVTGTMYKLNGEEDGQYEAVFKAGFTSEAQLLDYPKPAEPPFDRPSTVTEVTYLNLTKARWTFASGDSLSAPGPGVSYIAPLKNGGVQFWVSAAAFITGGTGQYEGAIGQECSLGSTYFTSKPDLKPGFSFGAKVIHIFKVVRHGDRAPLP